MTTHTVLVLGGGTGGITTARALRRRLASTDRVVLVERSPIFQFAPSFLWVMSGSRRTGQSVRFASYPILSPRDRALRSGGRRDGTPGDPRDWASSRRTTSPTSRPRIGRRR